MVKWLLIPLFAIPTAMLVAASQPIEHADITEPGIECDTLVAYPWHPLHGRWIILHLPGGETVTARLDECKSVLVPIPKEEG